jgi:lipoate-protein ligase B
MLSSVDMPPQSRDCLILRPGLVDYQDGWDIQRRAAEAVHSGGPHVLILLEHPPTYTLGVRARGEHLLLAEGALARLGAAVHRVDRGGDVTFHGPGQLVGYPILRLSDWGEGPLWYVRRLETALIDTLSAFGVAAGRVEGRPGVWVRNEKIAAIGVRVSRGITSHGFALNVDPDLSYFQHIVPCGLTDAGVTSMARLLPAAPAMAAVMEAAVDSFARVFGLKARESTLEEALSPVAVGLKPDPQQACAGGAPASGREACPTEGDVFPRPVGVEG